MFVLFFYLFLFICMLVCTVKFWSYWLVLQSYMCNYYLVLSAAVQSQCALTIDFLKTLVKTF